MYAAAAAETVAYGSPSGAVIVGDLVHGLLPMQAVKLSAQADVRVVTHHDGVVLLTNGMEFHDPQQILKGKLLTPAGAVLTQPSLFAVGQPVATPQSGVVSANGETFSVDFTDNKGTVLVSALSQWALIEKATGKLVRVPVEVAAPFLRDATGQERNA